MKKHLLSLIIILTLLNHSIVFAQNDGSVGSLGDQFQDVTWPVDIRDPVLLSSDPNRYDVSTYDKYLKAYNSFLAKIKASSSGNKVCIPVFNGKPIRSIVSGSVKGVGSKNCVIDTSSSTKCPDCAKSYEVKYNNLGADMCSSSFTLSEPVENGAYRPYLGDNGCDIETDVGSPVKPIGPPGAVKYKIRYSECSQCENGIPVSGSHAPSWDCKGVGTGRGDCAVQIQPLNVNNQPVGDWISYLHLSDLAGLEAGNIVDSNTVLGYSGTANKIPHLHIAFGDLNDPNVACDRVKSYIGSQRGIKPKDSINQGDVIGWASYQLFCFEIKKPKECSNRKNAFDILPKMTPLTKQEYIQKIKPYLLN